ncbi:MAG: hypothetical protein KDA88_12995, partial [Planctomycetaceae bacterium]|nr:hypothetical protein [Planctomycetaceae bacterium]
MPLKEEQIGLVLLTPDRPHFARYSNRISTAHQKNTGMPETTTGLFIAERLVIRNLNVTHIFVWLRGYLGGGGGV